jgi:glycosyltransferase involved in cell wall biosynthesis
MRIGIVSGEFPPQQGGVGAFTDVLSRYIHEQGAHVQIFSDTRSRTQVPEIPVFTPIRTWNLVALQTIRQWVLKNRIEIVNLQFQTAAFGMSPWIHFLPHVLPVPVVTTFHDLRFPYLFPKAGFLRNWIVRYLAAHSSGVITTNYEDDLGLQDLPNRRVIPIGSNILTALPEPYHRDLWRQRSGVSTGDFLVAYFGFINHTKGVDTLLQALAELDDSVHVVMIGDRVGTADRTNEAQARLIEKIIEDHHLEKRVHWTGFVPDQEVAAYLNAADIVALPFRDGASFRRGSLMAAIQYGCATITTFPATASPLLNQDTMYLIEADQPSRLVQAIKQLRTDPQQIDRLRAGIRTLQQEFDWKKIASDTVTFFQQVIEGAS